MADDGDGDDDVACTHNNIKLYAGATCYIRWCTKGSSSRQDQMEIDGKPTVSFARVILCDADAIAHDTKYCIPPRMYVCMYFSTRHRHKLFWSWTIRIISHIIVTAGLAFTNLLLLLLLWRKSMLCHFVMASSSSSHHGDYTLLIRINGNPFLVKQRMRRHWSVRAWTIKRIKLHLENIIQIYSYLFSASRPIHAKNNKQ